MRPVKVNTAVINASTGLAESVTVVAANKYISLQRDVWRNSKVVRQKAMFLDLFTFVERPEQHRDVRPRTVLDHITCCCSGRSSAGALWRWNLQLPVYTWGPGLSDKIVSTLRDGRPVNRGSTFSSVKIHCLPTAFGLSPPHSASRATGNGVLTPRVRRMEHEADF